MLESLFVTPAVTAIEEALASARASGPIAVVGNARLAKALGEKLEVIAVGLAPRAAKKHGGKMAQLGELPPRSIGAVVGTDASDASITDWARIVRDGGAIVTIDRNGAANASRRALCGGLTELEQRHAGRLVITSGLVTHL